MDIQILNRFRAIAGEENVLTDEPMRRHTTFRIGGPAAVFLTPDQPGQIAELLKVCREYSLPSFILGNGSNLLVSDSGFGGAVLCIDRKLQEITRDGCSLRVQAGALLSRVANAAREASLTGLEFAAGIPGTTGGACSMNAGAYGGEIRDVLRAVRILDEDLEERVVPAEELELGYRTSRIQKRGWVVLEAFFELTEGDPGAIEARMAELRDARAAKQPLEFPSAGSTFKRPEGYFAGKLIMDSGLAGFRVGGAEVSEKHCGFLINRHEATAEDMLALIRHVQDVVFEKYQVRLEPEVRFLGFPEDELPYGRA